VGQTITDSVYKAFVNKSLTLIMLEFFEASIRTDVELEYA